MQLKKQSFLTTYIITPILLAVATLIVYWPSLNFGFQFDDINNIQKFFGIRHWGLAKLFFKDSRWIGTWINTLNYRWSGFNAYSYRATNVAIHIAAAICIFYTLFYAFSFLKKKHFARTHAYTVSLITTTLFLLHPVQTQTVSYIIQGRLEGLATLFTMGVVLTFLLWSRAKQARAKVMYALLGIVLLIVGCGTKEIFIVTPFMVLLVDWFFVSQGQWKLFRKHWWVHLVTFGLVGGVYVYFKRKFIWEILTFTNAVNNNVGNVITQNSAQKITPFIYMMTQFKVILHYIWIFVWPVGLSVEYDWKLVHGFFDPNCFYPFLMLTGLLGIVAALLRRDSKNLYAFGILWFFVAILPRSSIVPSAELIVDYKTYLASMGLLMILALGVTHLSVFLADRFAKAQQGTLEVPKFAAGSLALNRIGMHSALIGYSFLALSLGMMSYQRNSVWGSGLAFWGDIVKHAPNKARGYNNYGVELLKNVRGNDTRGAREAIYYFKKAIKLSTERGTGSRYWDAFSNLGIAHNYLGNIELAIAASQQAILINPYHVESYNNLGKYYTVAKEFDRAHVAFRNAIRLRPHYGKAYYNWGNLYLQQNNLQNAYVCFKQCCNKADFDNVPHGFSAWGRTAILLNKLDEAEEGFKKALQIDPTYKEALLGLGNTYYSLRKPEKAREYYQRIAGLYPDDATGWTNIAQTYFEQGETKTAIEYLSKARKCANCPPQVGFTIAEYMAQKGEYTMARHLMREVLGNPQAPDTLKEAGRKLLEKIA